MGEQVYIRKEKVNYKIVLVVILLYSAAGAYTSVTRDGNSDWGVIGCVVLAILCWIFLFVTSSGRNEIIRRGEVVWAKVDKSRCEIYGIGIVIRAGYFWKSKKQFVEYQGSIRSVLDPKHHEYIEQLEKTKYVPVFVDRMNSDKYVMALFDLQVSAEEMDKSSRRKDIIRIIDAYKKEE